MEWVAEDLYLKMCEPLALLLNLFSFNSSMTSCGGVQRKLLVLQLHNSGIGEGLYSTYYLPERYN